MTSLSHSASLIPRLNLSISLIPRLNMPISCDGFFFNIKMWLLTTLKPFDAIFVNLTEKGFLTKRKKDNCNWQRPIEKTCDPWSCMQQAKSCRTWKNWKLIPSLPISSLTASPEKWCSIEHKTTKRFQQSQSKKANLYLLVLLWYHIFWISFRCHLDVLSGLLEILWTCDFTCYWSNCQLKQVNMVQMEPLRWAETSLTSGKIQ